VGSSGLASIDGCLDRRRPRDTTSAGCYLLGLLYSDRLGHASKVIDYGDELRCIDENTAAAFDDGRSLPKRPVNLKIKDENKKPTLSENLKLD